MAFKIGQKVTIIDGNEYYEPLAGDEACIKLLVHGGTPIDLQEGRVVAKCITSKNEEMYMVEYSNDNAFNQTRTMCLAFYEGNLRSSKKPYAPKVRYIASKKPVEGATKIGNTYVYPEL